MRVFVSFCGLLLFCGCFKPSHQLVVYCAQDQEYAEPIFRDFEKETGLKIGAVYDNEAVKTVGIANRLVAERAHPHCAVFWGNEEMRTRQLASEGIFRPNNGWAAFGYRSRRLVINTNLLSVSNAPRSLLELTNAVWRDKLAFAYPQFGTTSTHFHALRQRWGDALWQAWCRGLVANRAIVVDGNSLVVKVVGRGDAWLGMTDSDDIAAGQRERLPVAAMPLTPEMLLIPNTVGVVRGAPAEAQRLFDYLREPRVIQRLVDASALEGISARAVSVHTLDVDWDALLRDLGATTAELNKIFLR